VKIVAVPVLPGFAPVLPGFAGFARFCLVLRGFAVLEV
jgi:hypothetical protein